MQNADLMMTIIPSKMLYGFLRYSKKPKAVSFRIISRVNMLVKTMLQISRTLVSSSGWDENRKRKTKLKGQERCGSGYRLSSTKSGRQKIRGVRVKLQAF